MDYDKLASKLGGSVKETKQEVDYGALAAKLGGSIAQDDVQPQAPQAPQAQPQDDGFFSNLSYKNITENAKNLGGAILDAGASIGQTISYPVNAISDMVQGQPIGTQQADMRSKYDNLFAENFDTNSTGYKATKTIGQIGATWGVGGALARGAEALNRVKLAKLAKSFESGGMSLGGAPAANLTEKAINGVTRVAGGATTAAVSAGLVDPDSMGTAAGIGGAMPAGVKVAGGLGQVIAKGAQMAIGKVSEPVKKLAEKAEAYGIDIPVDRLVNNRPLNAVASSLNYVPFSGRAATEAKFESQLNRALSRTFGQDSDNVTMALRQASDDLGAKFDDVLKKNNVKFDNKLLSDIKATQAQATKELPTDGLTVINKQVDEIVAKAQNGLIDAQAAYNIKRSLDRIGQQNTPQAFHARQLKKDLMAALDRSLGTVAAKDFAKVRRQYGTMLDLENLAANGAEGGVSIARLGNLKNINNPMLQDLADISAQFLKAREGQHGAAQRAVVGGVAAITGGYPALVAGATAGRTVNTMLNAKASKNLVLDKPSTLRVNKKAQKLVTRSAPVLATD